MVKLFFHAALQIKGIHCVKSARIWSFSCLYFPALGRNMERHSVSFCIKSKCRKIRTRKTPNTNIFHALIFKTLSNICDLAFRENSRKPYPKIKGHPRDNCHSDPLHPSPPPTFSPSFQFSFPLIDLGASQLQLNKYNELICWYFL